MVEVDNDVAVEVFVDIAGLNVYDSDPLVKHHSISRYPFEILSAISMVLVAITEIELELLQHVKGK